MTGNFDLWRRVSRAVQRNLHDHETDDLPHSPFDTVIPILMLLFFCFVFLFCYFFHSSSFAKLYKKSKLRL